MLRLRLAHRAARVTIAGRAADSSRDRPVAGRCLGHRASARTVVSRRRVVPATRAEPGGADAVVGPGRDTPVLPFAWEDAQEVQERHAQAEAFFTRAASAGRPTIVFSQSDQPRPVPRDDVVVFQHAVHRSSLRPTDVAAPAWIDDPFPTGVPEGHERTWRPRPVVSFCGYAPPLGLPPQPWPRRAAAWPRDRFRRMRSALGIDERRGFSPPVF